MSSALLTLYRSLTRHRLYAILNIGGLALGLAVFLVLFLFVQHERGYDRFAGSDKLWAVNEVWHMPGLPVLPYYVTVGSLLDEIHGDFGDDIVGTRFWDQGDIAVQRGTTATADTMALVDPNYFDLFPFPALAGDPKAALRDPNAVIITQSVATRYFGSAPPLGQPMTLIIDGKPRLYHVGAVLGDLPDTLTFARDIIAAIVPARITDPYFSHWGSERVTVFLKLPSAAAAQALAARMPGLIDRHAGTDLGPKPSNTLTEELVPLRAVHLRQPKDRAIVAALGVVGLLTLLIAIVNYINLATARAGLRAREVALRKVVGGSRARLITQFVGEAVATAALAALIALALTELALPFVNALGGTALAVDYGGADSILIPIVLLVLVVGGIAGLYPAFVLSRFSPAAVLASARSPGGGRAGARVRQALVVGQFAVAIAFAIGTAVLVAQTAHLRRADLGFRRDGLIAVPSLGDPALDQAQRDDLLHAFAHIPGVSGVTVGSDAPAMLSMNAQPMKRAGDTGTAATITWMVTGPRYFDVLGAHLLAGRTLGVAHALDNYDFAALQKAGIDPGRTPNNIVVNRAALRFFGFATPQQAVGQTILAQYDDPPWRPLRIVGVVDDLRFQSPRDPVPPTTYFFQPERLMNAKALIRVAGRDPRAVLDAVEGAWTRIAPQVPFSGRTVNAELYEDYYKNDAQRSRLFTIGAILAVLIGCIGLYGLASFDTARRVKEIGIRKTLGASTRDIMRLLIGQFLRPVLIANLIAWPLAFFAMRKWLAGFDDRVALSPLFFIAASLIAIGIAAATVFGQAWRVARAEPARALRYE